MKRDHDGRPDLGRRGLMGLGAALLAAPALSGCSTPSRGPAVPRQLTGDVSVLGIPNERFLIPKDIGALVAEFEAAAARRAVIARNGPRRRDAERADVPRAVADYLSGMTDRFATREHARLTA